MKKSIKIVILVMIITLITCGITYSKYISNYVWDYYLKSKGFYFNSDVLSATGMTNSINSWDGNSVHFNIRNNFNKTLISELDINYTATCTITSPDTDATCSITDINEGVLSTEQVCINNTEDGINVDSYTKTECNEGGYFYTNQITENDLYFNIDEIGELTDLTVHVTVVANSPYTKTISGDFLLHKNNANDNIEFDYNNYEDYDKLIITNMASTTKCVLVSFDPSKLLIDRELDDFITYNSNLDGYINEFKVSLLSNEMKDYTFYKANNLNTNYNINEFNITNVAC